MGSVDIKLTEKQKYIIHQQLPRITILDGAVRTGKSYVANFMFLKALLASPEGSQSIIVGVSQKTVRDNILLPLKAILGNVMDYNLDHATINGRVIKIVGGSKVDAIKRIQGSTLAVALVDEGTLIHKDFLKMLLTRLSLKGSKLIMTTNPSHPQHYIKTEYIDRREKLGLNYFKFILDDNTYLSQEYKDALKLEHTGSFYSRYILGKWEQAEGLVYGSFDTVHHIINPGDIPKITTSFIGIDYGQVNPTVYLQIGLGVDNRLYVISEYYHTNKSSKGHDKSPLDYSNDFIKWIKANNIRNLKYIYIDPSASGLKTQLTQVGVSGIRKAKNSVLDGIAGVSSLIAKDLIRVSSNCKNVIDELHSYVWNLDKEIDKPVKEFDHTLDALRYVIFSNFRVFNKLNVKE